MRELDDDENIRKNVNVRTLEGIMAAIFSTRLDEELIERLDRVSRAIGVSKKKLVEDALRAHLDEMGQIDSPDVIDEACGAWKRREKPETTVRRVRKLFRDGLKRHGRDSS